MTASIASLLRQTTITDHNAVLQAATNASNDASDLDALHIRVVALLKLDRYEEALKLFTTFGNDLQEKARLEYAYALYKTGQIEQAIEEASKGQSRGLKHMHALAAYRDEQFDIAQHLYDTELSPATSTSDESIDLQVNKSAIDAQLQWAGYGSSLDDREDLQRQEAHEAIYNLACAHIARGDLEQAEILLDRAKATCNASSDLSESDKIAELWPITVQQVYVYSKLGNMDAARAMAASLPNEGCPDDLLRQIAPLNATLLASSSDNPHLNLTPPVHTKSSADRPFTFQANAMSQDVFTNSMRMQKFAGLAKSTARTMRKTQDGPTLNPSMNAIAVVNAAARARAIGDSDKDAKKIISMYREEQIDDIGTLLLLVQLDAQAKNYNGAIAQMEAFNEQLEQDDSDHVLTCRYAPGLVALLVSLYDARGQALEPRSELTKAVRFWQKREKVTQSSSAQQHALARLYLAAGRSLLASPDHEDRSSAAGIFADVHKRYPHNKYAAAGVLSSDDSTNKQISLSSSIQDLTRDVDVSALSVAGIYRPSLTTPPSSSSKKRSAQETDTNTQNATTAVPKTKKPRRLPKDADPNHKPDPERWLPLKDRSTYKPPKGKKRDAKARRDMASQGAVTSGTGSGPGAGAGTGGAAGNAPAVQDGAKSSVASEVVKKKKGKAKR